MSGNKPNNTSSESQLTAVQRLGRLPVYWYIILLVSLLLGGLYLYHLATGITPSRSAIYISAFDRDIYWYGIVIISGVALGTFVVSLLAQDKARRIFEAQVPEEVQTLSIDDLGLTAEILELLAKRNIETLGEMLFQWGLHPERLGFNRANIQEAQKTLETVPGVEEIWLNDAPWRIWNPDYAWNGIIVVFIIGLIGARLYHVFTPSPSMAARGIYSFMDYLRQPFELINIRNGGLGIYGGIVGGALGLLLYTRRNKIPTIGWADLGVIGVALGQFIGRWGNFLNQELFGKPTTLPWAVHIEPVYRPSGFEQFETFHPAFLYESLWNLLVFFVLYYLLRRYRDRLQTGDLVAVYLVGYAIGRILLEFVRLDSRMVDLGIVSIPVATLVSIIIALPMAILLVRRHLITNK